MELPGRTLKDTQLIAAFFCPHEITEEFPAFF
jgi:hypothetical protein